MRRSNLKKLSGLKLSGLWITALVGLIWLMPVWLMPMSAPNSASAAPDFRLNSEFDTGSVSEFNAVAIVSSNSPEPTAKSLLRAGNAAFQSGDYDLAIQQFTEVLELEPSSAAYSNRCLAEIYIEDYAAAIEDCSQALQLNPKEPESYLNRGLAYHRIGQPAEAIADYDHLLQLRPHDFRAYYNRGLAQAEQQAYREALVDYGEAIREVQPLDHVTLAAIHNDRGLAELWLEHQPQAIANFTQAIQFNGSDLRAYYNRGCAYHQQGQLAAALKDFTQVLQIAPDHAQAYLSRGLIRRQMGNLDAALADLQVAAEYFNQQGAKVAYLQTLQLIQKLRITDVAVG